MVWVSLKTTKPPLPLPYRICCTEPGSALGWPNGYQSIDTFELDGTNKIDDDILQLERDLARKLTIGHSTSRVVHRLEIVSLNSSHMSIYGCSP
jgi:hypothetical protein